MTSAGALARHRPPHGTGRRESPAATATKNDGAMTPKSREEGVRWSICAC